MITDLDVGGAERALVALAGRLSRVRWRPGVFCLGGPGLLAEALLKADVPCECLDVKRWNPVQAVTRLARGLRRFKPLLVQSFLFHANVASRLASPWAHCPWILGGLRVAERQKRWHLLIDRLTAPLATGSVCVSQGVYRYSRTAGGLDASRLTVIPNGIDPALYDVAVPIPRTAIGIPDDAHLALCVGRLDPQKGLPDLLDAADLILGRRNDWHLALAGDGPSRDWLIEQIVLRPRLRNNVHWLGRRDDVPNLLKSADVLVHASLWEGMPNAVLEAMAAGRPVIGTRVEGTEELIVPGETGWLVPPKDAVTLAQVLMQAADSPEVCRRYGEAGRLRVELEYSLESTVTAYERLWAGVLGFRLPESDSMPVAR